MMNSPKWCKWIDHAGPIIGQGKVIVTAKKNIPEAELLIPGIWWIRRCRRCNEKFSKSTDIVQRGVVPNAVQG